MTSTSVKVICADFVLISTRLKRNSFIFSVCGADETRTREQRRKALSLFEIGDVWGIGRHSTAKLESYGVHTALDFADKLPEYAQNILHKPGLLTWQELNGKDVIDISSLPLKQSITTSRTFATAITDLNLLEEQIANFCDHCARQLRMQHSECQQMMVYAHTSRFRTDIEPFYLSEVITLPVATANTQELLQYAMAAVKKHWKSGILFKKAGVILTKIVPEKSSQQDLFDTRDRNKEDRLQKAIDHINGRHGKRALVMAIQTKSQKEEEDHIYKEEHKSPLYTTDWRDIIDIKIK